MAVASDAYSGSTSREVHSSCASPEMASLSEQLAAQSALRVEAQQRLALRDAALDAASTLFMIIDAQAPDQPIVYVNRAHALLHGYVAPEELIGKSVFILVETYAPADKREALRTALLEGRQARVEIWAQHRDGSGSWLGISIVPIYDAAGKVTHFVTLGADITSRLEAERKKEQLQEQLLSEMRERERMSIELRVAQKLEAVGRLAAGLAHEINTPIQYVSDSVLFLQSAFHDLNRLLNAYSHALHSLPAGAIPPQMLQELKAVEVECDHEFLSEEVPKACVRTIEGIERVACIVRAMKEFAYPDVGQHNAADLNRALNTTLTVARGEYKYAARLSTEFGELPAVTCNVSELNQVFLNLIVNAAHAIQDAGKDASAGEICVTTRQVEGTHVEIIVADNGCGIAAEDVERIFDPFFTTKEVGRGTGQGLAIARSIVDKHGGEIRVRSEEGRGTEFTVRVPINSRCDEAVST